MPLFIPQKNTSRQKSFARKYATVFALCGLLLCITPLLLGITTLHAQESQATAPRESESAARSAAREAGETRQVAPDPQSQAAARADAAQVKANRTTAEAPGSSTGGVVDKLKEVAGYIGDAFNAQNLVSTGMKWLSQTALTIVAYLVSWSGMLLNIVLLKTVVQMKQAIDGMVVIDEVWKVVRDFINMLFLFGLLYAAVAHIIDAEAGKDLRRVIIHILIGAVFMNFSLVMTKSLIDVSNIVTIGIYEQLPGVSITDPNAPGLSNAMMQALRLQTIFEPGSKPGSVPSEAAAMSTLADLTTFLISTIMGSLLMLLAVVLFITASALFVVRFITLIFLLALSPLAFAGWALPFGQVKEYSSKWWKKLTQNLTFPITYMLLLWISFKILVGDGQRNITNAMGIDGVTFISSFTDLSTTTIAVGLNYAIVIGFMFYSLVTAVEASIPGAKWGQSQFMGLLNGTRGIIGRNTAGRAAAAFQNSETMRRIQSAVPGIGNKLYDTVGKAADAKYGGAKSFTTLVKDAGTRAAEGYKQTSSATITRSIGESEQAFNDRKEKAAIAARERGSAYVNSITNKTLLGSEGLAKSANYLTGGSATQNAIGKAVGEAEKEQKKKNREAENKLKIEAALNLEDANEQKKQIKAALAKMTDKEVAALGIKLLEKEALFTQLKDSHFDAIESSEMDDADKVKIKTRRYQKFDSALSTSNTRDLETALSAMSDKALRALNIEAMSEDQKNSLVGVGALKFSQFNALLEGVAPAVKEDLRNRRYAALKNGTPADIATSIEEMGPEEVASLPSEILEKQDVMNTFTVRILTKIGEKANNRTRRIIRDYITSPNFPAANTTKNMVECAAWLQSAAGSTFV